MVDAYFGRFVLPEDLHAALLKCRSIAYIETQEELDELVFGPTHSSRYDVVYNIVGNGSVKEAEVIRCKNGASVNFMEDYMRRRDPFGAGTDHHHQLDGHQRRAPDRQTAFSGALRLFLLEGPSGDNGLALRAAGHYASV